MDEYSISTHERYERNADLSWLIHWISMCSPFVFGPINEHEALNVLNWGFILRHDRGSKHRNGGPIMKVPLSGIDIWFVALFFRVSLLFGMRNSNDEWWIIRWWGFTECIGLKRFFFRTKWDVMVNAYYELLWCIRLWGWICYTPLGFSSHTSGGSSEPWSCIEVTYWCLGNGRIWYIIMINGD